MSTSKVTNQLVRQKYSSLERLEKEYLISSPNALYSDEVFKKKAKLVWSSMMNRCGTLKHDGIYANVTVCQTWKSFKAFYEWYVSNFPAYNLWQSLSGRSWSFCLDKDIKHLNNNIYSPLSCSIIPSDINLMFKGGDKHSSVSASKQKGWFENKLNQIERLEQLNGELYPEIIELVTNHLIQISANIKQDPINFILSGEYVPAFNRGVLQ